MIAPFSKEPSKVVQGKDKPVYIFDQDTETNADEAVIADFGEEWEKFSNFKEADITQFGDEYFDIADEDILNKQTYVLDMGCGSGRFSWYLSSRVGYIEALDPSKAIWAAEKLLSGISNVRMISASADSIPFPDNTFDLVMSIGVLHHIPNTEMAMKKCVSKVKPGGHFFVYLYYNLDNRGLAFRMLFRLVSAVRKFVSSLPSGVKKLICDLLAITVYLPVVYLGKMLDKIGLKKMAQQLPLSYYQDKSFFIIRNDALDRFGTRLENRFSKAQIQSMMENCGLTDIRFSDNKPFWHAIGKKKQA